MKIGFIMCRGIVEEKLFRTTSYCVLFIFPMCSFSTIRAKRKSDTFTLLNSISYYDPTPFQQSRKFLQQLR